MFSPLYINVPGTASVYKDDEILTKILLENHVYGKICERNPALTTLGQDDDYFEIFTRDPLGTYERWAYIRKKITAAGISISNDIGSF